MDKHRSHYGQYHVEPDVYLQRVDARHDGETEEPYGHGDQPDAAEQRIKHLLLGIHLKVLLVARSHTGDADEQEGRYLGIYQIAVMVDEPCLDAVMDVHEHAVPVVECLRIDGVLEKFKQQRHIDRRTEYLVKSLYLFCFFHRSLCCLFLCLLYCLFFSFL